MKKILFLFPLVLLIMGCGDKMSDDEMLDDTEEEIDDSCYPIETKRIEREETFYNLTLTDKASYEEDSFGYVLIDTLMNEKDTLLREQFKSAGIELYESNWDPVLGIITFSTDEKNPPPYITVTFQYDILSERLDDDDDLTLFAYDITSAGITLQDALEGTAAEIRARTIKYPFLVNQGQPVLHVEDYGCNYIFGYVDGELVERIYDNNGIFTGKIILIDVYCKFAVCTRC